jgi:hypothetical protein
LDKKRETIAPNDEQMQEVSDLEIGLELLLKD